MKKISTIIITSIIAISICGCSTSQPILNIEDYSLPSSLHDYFVPSTEIIKNAILKACRDSGWSPSVVREGLIEAELMVRQHRASVEIPYTGSHYSILYKDSQGLEYRENGEIHRNYNRWVVRLSGNIQRELGVRSQRF